jgi:hypothetical protein
MARDRARNDERSRIAHLAARLMAEDGVEDYAQAKRKAARQAGVPDTRQLPTNDEIDEALRLHQSLYQADAHRGRLRHLRTKAMAMMRRFERFNPYLTGSVLHGTAGKYADINLQLYTDNQKAVEHFLIDSGVDYRAGQLRLYVAGEARTVPAYVVDDDGTEVQLLVFTQQDLRAPVRTTADGKPMERAKPAAVATLLEAP